MDKHFVLCINNIGYETSLKKRKIYQVLFNKEEKEHNLIRVIDESGEDYLYPAIFFTSINIPEATKQKI